MSSLHSSHSSDPGEQLPVPKQPAAQNNPFEQAASQNNPFEQATSPNSSPEPATTHENPFESPDHTIEDINMGAVTSSLVSETPEALDKMHMSGRAKKTRVKGVSNKKPRSESSESDGFCFRFRPDPRRKKRASKPKLDIKLLVDEDYDENWVTEPDSDDETESDGDSSGGYFDERVPRHHRIPEEPGRFIDRSFNQRLPRAIGGWKNVRFYTRKEVKADTRMNDIFGDDGGRPLGRAEALDPLPVQRPRMMCQPDTVDWPDVKELLEKNGRDFLGFERRWRKVDKRMRREYLITEKRELARARRARDFRYLRIKGYKDFERIPFTKWDMINPLNWSLDLVPEWLQDFILWLKQVERIYYDDDTDWWMVIITMVAFWLGGVCGMLMVWVMSKAMLITGQLEMEGPGYLIPL
ncbi:hypothetical protein TWF281_006700 [Arthrobotrys megalospora]